MRFTTTVLTAAAAALAYAQIDDTGFEGPVLEIRANWQLGDCYKSAGSLTLNGTDTFQSQGACSGVAEPKNAKVIALTNGDTCYYGNALPPSGDKVDTSKCDTSCQGYPANNCGGSGFYRIWTNGAVSAAAGGSSSSEPSSTPAADDSSSAAAPSSSPNAVTVVTSAGAVQTVVVTQDPSVAAATITQTTQSTPTGESNNGGGTSHTAAIAAGVVVGVVGAAAIVGGIFFWLRSKKHHEEAAELQRQNSIAGLRSEKPPSTYSMPDSRLEPAYMRRMSDGSIADNQDYSRRILKVTNPDGR